MACILGLDVGTKRIGVARANAVGPALATPLCTVTRASVRADVAALAGLCAREGASAIVVGLPYDLQGQEGRIARLARQVGDALGAAAGLPVHYQDERYTSVEAGRRLREGGHDGLARKERIDASAAAVILQDWLDRRPGG